MVFLVGEEFHQLWVDEEFLAAEGHFVEHADFGQLFETKKTCRDFWILATCCEFMSLVGTCACNVFETCDFGDRSRTGSTGILKLEGIAGGDLLGEIVSEAGVNGGGGRNGGVGDGGGLLIRLRNPAGSHSPLGFEAIAARCPAPVV